VVLKRFRSLPSERITFDNPTIFVGLNGSGKSDLVSAFSFLADAMERGRDAGLTDFGCDPQGTPRTSVWGGRAIALKRA
jgi:predicted ATPase